VSDVTTTSQFVFFWGGWPSQWFKCRFRIDVLEYDCCEQFMMAEKARVFADWQAEAAILAATNPRKQKALGRQVRNFDAATWNAVCRGIVYRANLAKFEQNGELYDLLMATGERTIVEASPEDRIWGIGLRQDDPRAHVPAKWQGTNWLGVAIMQVRDELRRRKGVEAPPMDAELARQLEAREAIEAGHAGDES
jgi:ribA/ribD-fused uncharacterized protein